MAALYGTRPRDRSRERRRRPKQVDIPEEKPWFKKKTVWTTVATLATVVSLVPSTMSATGFLLWRCTCFSAQRSSIQQIS